MIDNFGLTSVWLKNWHKSSLQCAPPMFMNMWEVRQGSANINPRSLP